MNKIITPITADGLTGFDEFGQLCTRTPTDANGHWTAWIIGDVRGHECCICGQKWKTNFQATTFELQNQMTLENGRLLMHKTCYEGHAKLTERNFWLSKMYDLKVPFEITELNVRYPHSTPWYRIDIKNYDKDRTLCGVTLVVGRRKRVWEIRYYNPSFDLRGLLPTLDVKVTTAGEWAIIRADCPADQHEMLDMYAPKELPTGFPEIDALREPEYRLMQEILKDFDDVKDTKGTNIKHEDEPNLGPSVYIHAWSGEQVADYLGRFRKHFPVTTNYEHFHPKSE